MKAVFHSAESRGFADHGWLKSYHSFSFAGFYNQEKMNFGALRVLNDDTIDPGEGFGMHPHDNMEIISIPLEGELKHKDSMGNSIVIKEEDIQVMSAGTGINHSEFNNSTDKKGKFLQIWVIPDKKNVTPRYDQISIDPEDSINKLNQVLSPHKEDQGVWIYQNAWFFISRPEKGVSLNYQLKDDSNGVYIFLVEGKIDVCGHKLGNRDALGITETRSLDIQALSNSFVLIMEVPMTFER